MRRIKCQKSLSREIFEFLSLEVFEAVLEKALRGSFWPHIWPCFELEVEAETSSSPSNKLPHKFVSLNISPGKLYLSLWNVWFEDLFPTSQRFNPTLILCHKPMDNHPQKSQWAQKSQSPPIRETLCFGHTARNPSPVSLAHEPAHGCQGMVSARLSWWPTRGLDQMTFMSAHLWKCLWVPKSRAPILPTPAPPWDIDVAWKCLEVESRSNPTALSVMESQAALGWKEPCSQPPCMGRDASH